MAENKTKPSLRFRGFTDEWEQRKLLDCILKIIDFRGRTPKKLGMEWSESGYLALSALNVKDGYIDFSQDVHYGNQALYEKWMSGNELHMGQVLFTTEAPMGKVAQVPDNKPYILSQRTIAFDVKQNEITENFLATVLRTPAVFSRLTALSSGGTAKGVSQKSLSTVDVVIPSDLNEQEKLADVFLHIDNLIALHQQKHEKLVNLEKSMLEKMFPQNGSAYPEIRFSGFTAPWEKRKFSDIAQRESTFRTSSSIYPSIEYEDVVAEVGLLNKDIRKKETHKTGIEFDGTQVLYGKLRPYLHNWLSPDFKGVAVGDWWVLRPLGIDKNFLFRLIQTRQFNEVANQSSGSKMPRADWHLVSNMEFFIPKTSDEQSQIAKNFDDIDTLITLHQHKLEKLKNLKKSMLQRMFV